MKHRIFFILLSASIILTSGCEKKKEQESDTDLPNDKMSVKSIGLAYLEENQLDNAEASFKKLIDIDSKDPMGYANLGLVYLRMGQYDQAAEQAKKALEINPNSPDIRLILANIYEHSTQSEAAVKELEKIIEQNPEFPKAYYSLAQQYTKNENEETLKKREEYLTKLVELVPANIVPRLQLLEVLAKNDKPDECLKHLDKLKEIVPVFPQESEEYFNQAKQLLHQGYATEALTPIRIFHNFMKLTTLYTSGNKEIKGPGGEHIGFPVITTSRAKPLYVSEDQSLIDIMKFTDAAVVTGLQPEEGHKEKIESAILTITDYDSDGDIDIYYSYTPTGASSSTYYLFDNDLGSFTDVKEKVGIDHEGLEKSATFTDYNNDGFMDLFITMENSCVLYKNDGDSKYTNVTTEVGLSQNANGNKALFSDLDHEGDLDLFIAKNGNNNLYRNNADGTFTEQAEEMGLTGNDNETLDVRFGDFDEDGDLDLFTVNNDGNNALFSNLRQSRFKNIAEEVGIASSGNSRTAAISDYNNDGMLDIFIAGNNGLYELYKNNGDGTFGKDAQSASAFKSLEGITSHDAIFVDFDNDGYEDLLVAGTSNNSDKKGVKLFHNDSLGNFSDVSHLLPENVKGAYKAEIADFNEDGDLDIFLAGPNGAHLIRNESGNMNHYIKVQLVGLSNGNGKNNRLGIGAKVELRAGNHYQMKTVTKPVMHFGLGKKENADILRIVWTNGVPQNIISPKSDQDLVEEQMLKGSCPFLYTWNGEKYVFVKDMMWRSALGMPLGIMGDETAFAFPNISKEYLKIPGELLKPKDGKYSIKVTKELWETVYFDKASLVAVDHPASVDIFVDEKFVLPPFPERELYKVPEKQKPVSATDGDGNNILPEIAEHDDNYISNLNRTKYQGITEMHELILDLGDKANSEQLYLFLRGWIFPTDASINKAISQTNKHKAIPPSLQVINENGEWETVIESLGFPMGKDKTVIADLSGKFLSDDRKVKITTSMQIYWDHIFFSECAPESPVQMTDLKMLNADLHFRGYSAMYRKGGQYGPHWFDYYDVTKGQKWRDLTGNYTRYGDVLPLLTEGDDKYIIANAGDEVAIEFSAEGLPELPKGWERDFLIYSEGWVKDGDLNTAHGQTVEPLPFRNMSSYPYGEDESYPDDEEHNIYRKKYNTREVGTDDFKDALKPNRKINKNNEYTSLNTE